MTIPGPIPITIQSFFWLFAALIGWLNSQSIIGTFVWIGIIFLSVLFHEFGHALTATLFRQQAQIQLVALGGLTTFQGPKLPFWKQFIIVLNGPLAGILLFFIASFFLYIPFPPFILSIIGTIRLVNLFWSIVNLFPVIPLDGGQLLRIALEGFFGVKGFKASLLIGMIFAILVSFYFFLAQAFLIGAFFFLFAFQSFDLWRKSRKATDLDREEDFKKMLAASEELLQKGQKLQAQQILEEIHSKGGNGLIASAASQYLAFLYTEEGKRKESYELLLSCKNALDLPSKCLLHQLAAEFGNYQLVADLSGECYQHAPKQDVALRNAIAFAALNEPEPAGGWLQTAWQYGPFDLKTLLNEEIFNRVKDDSKFRHFVDRLL